MSGALTLVPAAALVVKVHDLGDEKLGKCLIVRNARQHLTELPNDRHKLDRALCIQCQQALDDTNNQYLP